MPVAAGVVAGVLAAAFQTDVEMPAQGGSPAAADGREDLALDGADLPLQIRQVPSHDVRDFELGPRVGHAAGLWLQAIQGALHGQIWLVETWV